MRPLFVCMYTHKRARVFPAKTGARIIRDRIHRRKYHLRVYIYYTLLYTKTFLEITFVAIDSENPVPMYNIRKPAGRLNK